LEGLRHSYYIRIIHKSACGYNNCWFARIVVQTAALLIRRKLKKKYNDMGWFSGHVVLIAIGLLRSVLHAQGLCVKI